MKQLFYSTTSHCTSLTTALPSSLYDNVKLESVAFVNAKEAVFLSASASTGVKNTSEIQHKLAVIVLFRLA